MEELFNDDFVKYNTIEHLKLALQNLRSLDLSQANAEQVHNAYYSCLNVLPSLNGFYSVKKFNAFNFYRVRLNIDAEKEDIGLIQTYSYPPSEYCFNNGRANLKKKSVFYCSNCALTAVLESKPKVGDVGYLSVWQGRSIKDVKAGIILPRDLKRDNIWQGLSEDAHSFFENYLLESKNEKASFYQEIVNFIADLFITERRPYPITSWIANEMIYGSKWKDFIVYPSFVNDAFSCNLAIHPNTVNNCLLFTKVIKFKVLEIGGGGLRFSTGHLGEITNTNIQWRKAKAEEEVDFSLFPHSMDSK